MAISRQLLTLTVPALLSGCVVDGRTNEVKGPVYVGGMLVAAAALSRPAAKPPPEWEAVCAGSFDIQWLKPRPAPDGVVVGGFNQVALALRRTGATHVGVHIDDETADRTRAVFPRSGAYRVRRTNRSPACDAALDKTAADRETSSRSLVAAAHCLSVERVGEYRMLHMKTGSDTARYLVRGTYEERHLGGGDFRLAQTGQELIDQQTGERIAHQRLSAVLFWRPPDDKHLYWGSSRDCGPQGFHRYDPGLLGRPLFS